MTHPQLAFAQARKPAFHIVPIGGQRRRDSFCGIVYDRYLEWVRKAKPSAILAAIGTAATLPLLLLAFLFPYFALGLLVGALKWNGYRIPLYLASCALLLNATRIWRCLARLLAWRRKAADAQQAANQHTFRGVPVDELAEFLMEKKAFKLQDTLEHFRFSQRKYNKIAEDLEKHRVLVRGENNARVLADISYAELARQLRDDFPLAWDEVGKCWVEKDDPYGRFLREKSFRQRKLEEDAARKERKVERLEKKIEAKREELDGLDSLAVVESPSQATFDQVLALAARSAG